nr:uncharacterized protein LOC105872229 [Microcebus murinus]
MVRGGKPAPQVAAPRRRSAALAEPSETKTAFTGRPRARTSSRTSPATLPRPQEGASGERARLRPRAGASGNSAAERGGRGARNWRAQAAAGPASRVSQRRPAPGLHGNRELGAGGALRAAGSRGIWLALLSPRELLFSRGLDAGFRPPHAVCPPGRPFPPSSRGVPAGTRFPPEARLLVTAELAEAQGSSMEFEAALVDLRLPWWTSSCPGGPPAAQVDLQLPRWTSSCPGGPPAALVNLQLPRCTSSCPGAPPAAQVDLQLPKWTSAAQVDLQ